MVSAMILWMKKRRQQLVPHALPARHHLIGEKHHGVSTNFFSEMPRLYFLQEAVQPLLFREHQEGLAKERQRSHPGLTLRKHPFLWKIPHGAASCATNIFVLVQALHTAETLGAARYRELVEAGSVHADGVLPFDLSAIHAGLTA